MKKNLILSTLYQILTMITPLLTAPYISRVLGADGIGIYSYTSSIVMYFCMFAALGTGSYGAREIARHRDDPDQYSKLFWEIELLTVITTTICLILWLVWCCITRLYQIYFLILTLSLVSILFDIAWFYTGMEEFQFTVTLNTFLKLLGIVAIFLFVKEKEDLYIYFLITSGAAFLGSISMWFYAPRFLKLPSLSTLSILPHLRNTLLYFIPTVAASIYTILDKTLLGAITHSEFENGFYEQATKIVNLAKAVTFAGLNTVLGSRISWLFAQKAYDEIRDKIALSMDFILFMGIGMCFGIWGVADTFIPLFFGPGYEKTALLLKIMCPLIVIIGVSNCLGAQYYTPAGLMPQSTRFLIVGSCVNLVLNVILIPRLASVGAVLATIAAELTISTLFLRFCNGYLHLSIILRQSAKKIIAGAVMLILVIWIGTFTHSIWGIILQISGGFLSYVFILNVLKDSVIYDILLPAVKK